MGALLDMVAASLDLTRRGRAHWAKCPFHEPDKTGSFKVEEYGGKERFYCFGCGAKGDAADWLMITRKVSYVEAKRILGEETARPDPAIKAARDAEDRRREIIGAYRDRNPDCCLPDWAIGTSERRPASTGPP